MSRGVNKVILIGNVVKDPIIKFTNNQKQIARISLATTESYRDKTSGESKTVTEWHNVVVFGKLSQVVSDYVRKGMKLYVEGSIRTRSYEQENTKKYITEINASVINILSSKDFKNSDQQEDNNRNIVQKETSIDDDYPF